MNWISNNATELTVFGSIFMNMATLVIIFFNLNQLKLNNRSLNVDINFKVFELRKTIYKDIVQFIKGLSPEKGFRQYLLEDQNGEYQVAPEFNKLKESIENCKHLFSAQFAMELELLLLNIEQGIAIEQKTIELKHKDASTWTAQDQETLHGLGERRNAAINSILNFKSEQFLPYLNVANFHKNLMEQDETIAGSKQNLFTKFNKIIFSFRTFIPKKEISYFKKVG